MKKTLLFLSAFVLTCFGVWASGALDSSVNENGSEGPADLTEKIVNPGFTDDSSTGQSGWTLVTGSAKGKWSAGTENRAFSCNNIKCELTQTIEGLEPGLYKLEYQAFGRMQTNAASWAAYLAGEDLGSTNVYMIANDTKKEVMNVVYGATPTKGAGSWTEVQDAKGNTLYLLDNSGAVADAFAQGYYEDQLVAEVGEDGKLTITFLKESEQESSSDYSKYAGCDNFRLSGPLQQLPDETIQEVLTMMPSEEAPMNAAINESLWESFGMFMENPSYANYKELLGQIDNANASIRMYAEVKAAWESIEASLEGDLLEAFQSNDNVAGVKAAYDEMSLAGDAAGYINVLKAAVTSARLALIEGNDLTEILANPNFNDGTNGWTINNGKIEVKAANTGNPVVTAYNYQVDICQTIAGLTPGYYVVKVQACSRYMNLEAGIKDFESRKANGEEIPNEAYLYANGAQKKIVNIYDETSTYDFASESGQAASDLTMSNGEQIPYNSTNFAHAFSAGMYENELVCEVGEDGILTLGLKNELKAEGDFIPYVGYDNFRLYRYEDAQLVSVTPEQGSRVGIDTEYTITFSQPVTYKVSLSDISVGGNAFGDEDGAFFTQSEDGTQITCKLDKEVLAMYGIETDEDLSAKMGNNVFVHLWKVKDAATGELVEGCYDEEEDLDQFAFQFSLGDPVLVVEPTYGTVTSLEQIYFSCADGIAIADGSKNILVMKNKEQILSVPASELEVLSYEFFDDEEDDFGFGGDENVQAYILNFNPALTEAGTYEVYIPNGTFTLGGTALNEASIYTYTIESSVEGSGISVTPAEGVVTSIETIRLAYNDGEMIAPGYTENLTITDAEGNVVATITQDEMNEGLVLADPDNYWSDIIAIEVTLAEPITAPGTYTLNVPEEAFCVGESYDWSKAASFTWTIEGEEGNSIDIALNEAGLATFSAATDMVVATTGAKAFTAEIKGGDILLTEIGGIIPAGTGVILYGPGAAIELTEPTVDGLVYIENNDLKPTTTPECALVEVEANAYVLGAGNQFLQYTGAAFKANRAYLVPEDGLIRLGKMQIVFDEATGIDTINAISQEALYNLFGVRTNANTKGVVIKNGKKMIVK